MVFLGNICMDTLHKGDNDDDDDKIIIINCKWAVAQWQWL
jgi:hypothetical protein